MTRRTEASSAFGEVTRRTEASSAFEEVTRRTEASSAFGEVIRMLGTIALVTRRALSVQLRARKSNAAVAKS